MVRTAPFAVLAGSAILTSISARALEGPYDTERRVVHIDGLQEGLQQALVYVPVPKTAGNAGALGSAERPVRLTENETFPLLSFSHGDFGGGYDLYAYDGLLREVASHGIVVAAHMSCGPLEWGAGCGDRQYKDQLRVVDWALGGGAAASDLPVDLSGGVAVGGHSTGGRSSFQSAAEATQHNISVAVAIHPDPMEAAASNARCPVLVGTGTWDVLEPHGSALKDYEALPTSLPRAFISLKGVGHLDPVSPHSHWGLYAAAFVKVFTGHDTRGSEYRELICDQHLCSTPLYPSSDCRVAGISCSPVLVI